MQKQIQIKENKNEIVGISSCLTTVTQNVIALKKILLITFFFKKICALTYLHLVNSIFRFTGNYVKKMNITHAFVLFPWNKMKPRNKRNNIEVNLPHRENGEWKKYPTATTILAWICLYHLLFRSHTVQFCESLYNNIYTIHLDISVYIQWHETRKKN